MRSHAAPERHPGALRGARRTSPSVTVGIWVENGSRYETPRAGRHLALPRAPLLQGHGAADGGADRGGDRRGRRRAERVHRQGVHLLLREGAARAPAARARPPRRHLHCTRASPRRRSSASARSSSRRSRRSRTRPTTTSTISSTWPSGRGIRSSRPVAGTRGDGRAAPRGTTSCASSRRATVPTAILVAGRGQRRARRRWSTSSSAHVRRPAAAASVAVDGAPPVAAAGVSVHEKALEQVHLCLGAPGIAQTDPDRYAAHLLNAGARRRHELAALPGDPRAARQGVHGLLVPARRYLDAGYLGVYVGTSAGVGARGGRGHPRRAARGGRARGSRADELDARRRTR